MALTEEILEQGKVLDAEIDALEEKIASLDRTLAILQDPTLLSDKFSVEISMRNYQLHKDRDEALVSVTELDASTYIDTVTAFRLVLETSRVAKQAEFSALCGS